MLIRLLLIGIALVARTAHAQAAPQATATLSPAALRADLALVRTEFMVRDHSFSPSARSQAEVRLAALESGLDTVSRAWFELELARIVALADNGHTGAVARLRAARFNRIALRFVPFGDDFYVLGAGAANADLLGARLVRIDERPIAEIRVVARTLSGGTAERRDRFAPFFLESPQQMHTMGVIAHPDAATYHFELPDRRRSDRRMVAEATVANPTRPGVNGWMYPANALTEGEGWRGLPAPERAPWALQDASTPFRWRDAPELGAVVIEMRQNVNAPGRPIGEFLTEIEGELRRRQPQHVVLDMRMNGGGNLQTTRDFMQELPTLVPGRVFVLTSPWTFSAAISSIGYLEQTAPERVTIVGEMVGDRLEFWAEGGPLTLPNSGIVISMATQRHDYATGCRPYTDCHRAVVVNPISVRSLAPDIAAPWTIEAYRAGRDPAMDAVAAALR